MDDDLKRWTDADQRRADTFTRDVLTPLLAAGDLHLVFVAVHGFLNAAAAAMAHDVERRPTFAWYYLNAIDAMREHVERAAIAATAALAPPGPRN